MTRTRPIVAIDGPAGAGKSSVAREVARALGFVLVDTGALYRGLALAAQEAEVPWSDGEALGALAASLDLRFETHDDGPHLILGGVDRAGDIRAPAISEGASQVSAHPPVRDALLGIQRQLGADGGVVLEGRDIGTVVFPDAEVKVFLTASPEERARRRVQDLEGRGVKADHAEILAAIRTRDARDAGRDVAPLIAAADAVTLDSTELQRDDVVARIVALVRSR